MFGDTFSINLPLGFMRGVAQNLGPIGAADVLLDTYKQTDKQKLYKDSILKLSKM